MKRRGYSLIELLIVIAILGLLAAVGSYSWASTGARSRDSSRKTDLARIKNSLQQYYSDNRQYPNFDAGQGRIYSATWQLSNATAPCAHAGSAAKRLTSTYIDKVPEDPNQRTNFSDEACVDMVKGQTKRYYYLSSPTDDTNGVPQKPATGFALMAHLERGGDSDLVTDSNNPLKNGNISAFGDYYSGVENYASEIGADVNYLLTGQFGR